MPAVSIVLASYNGEKYIAQQLDSLLAQAYHDFEIVATDDASSDSTVAILRDYSTRFPGRIRLIKGDRNIGCSANFERGIRAAGGEYIALCDQDDVWLPSKLSRMMACFREGVNLVFCDLEIVDENLKPLGYGMWKSLGFSRRDRRRLSGKRGYELLMCRSVVSGCGMIMRSEVAMAALPIPDRDSNVHDQWLARIASFTGRIVPCPERLVLYRQHRAQQAGGVKLGVATVMRMEESKFEGERIQRRWAILVDKLGSLGVGHQKLDFAKRWSAEHLEFERRRSQELSLGLLLAFAMRGVYARHFSGLRSVAKDLVLLFR